MILLWTHDAHTAHKGAPRGVVGEVKCVVGLASGGAKGAGDVAATGEP